MGKDEAQQTGGEKNMGGREREEKRQEMTWKGKGDGEGKEDENRQTKIFVVVVVVLHSSVLKSIQSSACVGRRATDSDRC